MDPMTLVTFAKAGSAVASGLGAMSQGMTEAARQDSEARLAETQALQRDTNARDDLNAHLSATRAARAANGLSALSPNALKLTSEANRIMTNERQIMTANDRQRAANLRAGAKASRQGAAISLVTGVAKAAVPVGQYYSYGSS